jgi:DNA-binding beta-propeller fold protein YncE
MRSHEMSTEMSTDALRRPLRFKPCPEWVKLPYGMSFSGDATSVAVDSRDRVYVFNRGPVPVIVFDGDGNYLESWGENEFESAHAVAVDHDDNIWLVDHEGHTVEKRTLDGKVLLTLGTRGDPAAWQSNEPFNGPTDVAVHPRTGDVFVSDGYDNSCIHRFDADGRHVQTWGESGTDAGQFSNPHGIAVLSDDRVAVCDRENFRIQIFTTDGEYLNAWYCHHPDGITCFDGMLYVAELGPPWHQGGKAKLGNRVSIFDPAGSLVGRFGNAYAGAGADQFLAPHGIAVDSSGDVYVAEVSWSWTITWGPGTIGLPQAEAPHGEMVSLRKWNRIS